MAPNQLREEQQPLVSSWDHGKMMEKNQLPHPVLTAALLLEKMDGLGVIEASSAMVTANAKNKC